MGRKFRTSQGIFEVFRFLGKTLSVKLHLDHFEEVLGRPWVDFPGCRRGVLLGKKIQIVTCVKGLLR